MISKVRGGLGDTSAAWMGKLRPRVCWRLTKLLRIPCGVFRIGLYSFLVGRCCPVPGSPGLEGWGSTCFYTPQDSSVMNESIRKWPKGTGSQTHQRNEGPCTLLRLQSLMMWFMKCQGLLILLCFIQPLSWKYGPSLCICSNCVAICFYRGGLAM